MNHQEPPITPADIIAAKVANVTALAESVYEIKDRSSIGPDEVCQRLAKMAEAVPMMEEAIDFLTTLIGHGLPTEEDSTEASGVMPGVVIDFAILMTRLGKALDEAMKINTSRLDRVKRLALETMAEEGTQNITRHGMTLYLTTERAVVAKFDDLLPPEVDPSDPQYEASIEAAKASAQERLLERLRESELAHLVKTSVNAASLRSVCVGTNAERDEDGEPIIPECIADVVTVNSWTEIRARKAAAPKAVAGSRKK